MAADEGPLAGRRIGITADRRGQEQADLFCRRGAEVVHGPTLRTIDLSASDDLRHATTDLIDDPPDFLVVTTGMGMRMWLESASGWGLQPALGQTLERTRNVARGAKAASAVRGAGLELWWQAPHETVAEVVDRLSGEPLAGARVAVQLFDPDATSDFDRLRNAGATVVELPVYRWALPDDPGAGLVLIDEAVNGRLDAVTFTSQPAVRQLFHMAAGAGHAERLRYQFDTLVVASCVGPVCAQAALEVGIARPLFPDPPRLVAMVRQLTEKLSGNGAPKPDRLTRDSG